MVISRPCMVDATGEPICPPSGGDSGRSQGKPPRKSPPGGFPPVDKPIYHLENTPTNIMSEAEARARGYWVDRDYHADTQFWLDDDQPVDSGLLAWSRAERYYSSEGPYYPSSGIVHQLGSGGSYGVNVYNERVPPYVRSRTRSSVWGRPIAEAIYPGPYTGDYDVGLLAESRRLREEWLKPVGEYSFTIGEWRPRSILDWFDAPAVGWQMIARDVGDWLDRHDSVKVLFFSPGYFLGEVTYKIARGESLDKAVASSLRDSVEFGVNTVLHVPVGVASLVSPSAWASMARSETYREMGRIIVAGSPSERGALVGTLIGAAVGGKALGVAGKAIRYRNVDVAPTRPSTLRAPVETPAEAIRRAFYEAEITQLFESYTRGHLSKGGLLEALEKASRGEKPRGPTRVYHATSASIPSKFSVLEGSSPTPGLYVAPKAYPAFAVGAVLKMGVIDRLRLLGADLGRPQFLRLLVEDVVLPEKGYGKAPANAPWRSRVVPGLTDIEGFLEYQGFVRHHAGRPIAIVSPEVASKLPWRGLLEVEAIIPPETVFRETLASRLLRYKTEVSAPELRVRIKNVLEFSSREEAKAFARRSKDLVVVKGRKAYILEGEWSGRYKRVPVRVRDFIPDEFEETSGAGGIDLFSGRRGGYVIDSLLDRGIGYARDLLLRFRFNPGSRFMESSVRSSGYTGGGFGDLWRMPGLNSPGSEGRVGLHGTLVEGEGRGTSGSASHGNGGRGGSISSGIGGSGGGGSYPRGGYRYPRVPGVNVRGIGRGKGGGGRSIASNKRKKKLRRKPTRRSRVRKRGRRIGYSEILYPVAVFPLDVKF